MTWSDLLNTETSRLVLDGAGEVPSLPVTEDVQTLRTYVGITSVSQLCSCDCILILFIQGCVMFISVLYGVLMTKWFISTCLCDRDSS